MAYRRTIHTTKFSPHFLVFGQAMNLFYDTTVMSKAHFPENVHTHIQNITDNLSIAQDLAKEHIEKSQD